MPRLSGRQLPSWTLEKYWHDWMALMALFTALALFDSTWVIYLNFVLFWEVAAMVTRFWRLPCDLCFLLTTTLACLLLLFIVLLVVHGYVFHIVADVACAGNHNKAESGNEGTYGISDYEKDCLGFVWELATLRRG